jgi:phage recombination protein Bet
MKAMSLEEQLERSVLHARAKKVQKMTQAIELSERPVALVVHRDVSAPLEFTPQQSQMIRDTYANGASEKEFQVLMEGAKVRRLNPLLRQVHFVKRSAWDERTKSKKDVWSVQVSVDGLRAIAERTGKYDGQDEPEYVRDAEGLITACKVRVYRKDWSRPSIGVAYWSEYVQTKQDGTPTRFWADMPHVMIAKCAEAIAMRKAFPEDMGGLYVDEEMQQADNVRQVDNGTTGAYNAHQLPGEASDATSDADLIRDLCSRFAAIETSLEACDSWEKTAALRALLGTRAQQSDLTRTMQQKAEAGDISPTQRAELGKTWMRCNRKLEKLEATHKPPPIESSFIDPDDEHEELRE